jgi:DNA-directed RNA polymerase specialized sigma24 family protein
VADRASSPRAPADAKLLEQVRTGDTSAFGVLYERHVQAVQRLARELVVSPAEADHLVAETFGLVHDVTRGGGGPADAFRPYLLAALGRVAAGRVGDRRVPAAGDPGPGEPLALIPDDAHAARAFLSLPEHTRAVLWHTEIEQGTPAAVAPLLGASPNGVATLRRRARESLRQALLSTHAARLSRPECQSVAEHLGDYQRGARPADDPAAAPIAAHLSQCGDCSAVIGALGDVTSALRDQVAPLYLGGATAAYLLGARRADARGAGAADSGDTRELPVAADAPPGRRVRRAWVAAGAALAVGAIAAVLALTGYATPPRAAGNSQADAMPSVGGTTSTGSAHTPAPARSGRHSSSAGPASSSSPAPRPQPSTSAPGMPKAGPSGSSAPGGSGAPASTPAPAVVLTASVSVQQAMHLNEVAFQVSDSGTAATGSLTATITLPAGSWLLGLVHGHGGAGGWSCQPTSTGASCQHGAISAGAEASGTILIGAAGSACGQSAQLSAASGTASATAQSAQDIQCG